MKCFRRILLPLFLIFLLYPYTNSCEHFIVQPCTDIPFYFPTTKCIQLIPNQFDLSISYSVQNYVVVKAANCFNIRSYESPSSILFSNECREQCPEQYCLLFDNQSNTSVINIFFSQSSTYELTNSETNNNHSSYDYFLFDQCSSSNRANQILLIIVYVLCGVIVLLTILVIGKYISSCILRREEHYDEDKYNLIWICHVLCCRVLGDKSIPKKQDRDTSDLDIVENNNQPNTNNIRPGGVRVEPDNFLDPSSLSDNMVFSSSDNNREPRSYPIDTSGSSPDPRHRSESSILPRHDSRNIFYMHVRDTDEKSEDSDSVSTITKSRGPSLKQRVSYKTGVLLSAIPSLTKQNSLGPKESVPIEKKSISLTDTLSAVAIIVRGAHKLVVITRDTSQSALKNLICLHVI